MPLRFGKNIVVFEEGGAVEEALPLLEYLQTHPGARVDLRACTHMHTAIVQVLMALGPKIAAVPTEPFLHRWLTPLLTPFLPKVGK
ncbi:MAG: hypothetical protein VR70_04145 [Rhodospirillaceae bacterium BRH_c57]|nr:MAG: hypothetical protein VR70_04145 [Rhodospirillaceae bacterium BRH_c57]